MVLDVYSLAETRRAELEVALRRRELLREAGVGDGPSLASRLAGRLGRVTGRTRPLGGGREAPTPAPPSYRARGCVSEPA